MGAVRSLVRLRLFPAVFAAPEPVAGPLGEDYGAPCAAVMASVHELMGGWQPLVRSGFGLKPKPRFKADRHRASAPCSASVGPKSVADH